MILLWFIIATQQIENWTGAELFFYILPEMEKVTKALGSGADEYVMKPFTPEIMHEKLEVLGFEKAENG